MEHPYRVHSSIGFGFLQLLMLSSIAYPTPPPPLYHHIAVTRMMGTVYFTLFQDKPIYLKLECATILLEVIRDALYIKYIIKDYTYLFGVFDIIGNLLFCTVVVLSIENGENRWSNISESFEGIRKTCIRCCFGGSPPPNDGKLAQASGSGDRGMGGGAHEAPREMDTRGHLYQSLATNENDNKAPVYTFGSRQAFKPSFYSSSWGREYLNAKIDREFDRIDTSGDGDNISVISRTDGTTQYIRFDDAEAAAAAAAATGANHYANIFVSPYFTKDGSPITSFSGWTKVDSIGVCLFIYNLIQFIYQLVMYSSIVGSCREYHGSAAPTEAAENGILARWLC